MTQQQSFTSNQLLQNLDGGRLHSKEPTSSKIGKWSKRIHTCLVTLEFAKISSQLLDIRNLSNRDRKMTPSQDQVNVSLLSGISIHCVVAMNLLNLLIPLVTLPLRKHSWIHLIILKSPSMHQGSSQ